MYHILLYYKFVKIADPDTVMITHREVCRALGLKGRILISKDGINGTVGGDKFAIDRYRAYMDEHRYFKNIDWKESTSEKEEFSRLRVRSRGEVITTGALPDINLCSTGRHVDRDTFHKWLVRGEDMVILDMRNDYEWDIGRFVNAVRPPMRFFRELKDNMDFYAQFRGRKIVMFCTGGIRCEPASAYFIEKGFDAKDIYQLDGGIVKYAEKYGDEGYYEGKCYVFDERISILVDTTANAKVVGKCYHCGNPSDVYRNCLNKYCNRHYIGCDECVEAHARTCAVECLEAIRDEENKRPERGL
jgi:UPF0176 protein